MERAPSGDSSGGGGDFAGSTWVAAGRRVESRFAVPPRADGSAGETCEHHGELLKKWRTADIRRADSRLRDRLGSQNEPAPAVAGSFCDPNRHKREVFAVAQQALTRQRQLLVTRQSGAPAISIV